MRSINPETGRPWPRHRPINWPSLKAILAYRKESKRLSDDGFIRVGAFSNLPWESPNISHLVVEARIAHGGRSLWVKLEPRQDRTPPLPGASLLLF